MLPSPIFTFSGGIIPGSQEYSTPGTYSFKVPKYKTLVIRLWGAGGGGAEAVALNNVDVGTNGGNTSFNANLIAYGGERGYGYYGGSRRPGNGGSFLNGDSGSAAGAAGQYAGSVGGTGGSSPNGGAGGVGTGGQGGNGGFPGGGGAGGFYNGTLKGSGAGGGGYCIKTYTAGASGAPNPGDIVTVVVGAGGVSNNQSATYPDGGNGGHGRAIIDWS